ncbi:MAG TPA: hypothetical protein VGN46_08685 [Luteibacter sp.]|jgi:hypothetical protein|uniref:hypothetical protein n=1 Tax=Luteibacter sp. TaxID=1886636 RepID=UPI002F412582
MENNETQNEQAQAKGRRVRMVSLNGHPVRDLDLTSTDQFNIAMEWLQYSRSSAQLLADLLHEADEVDVQDTALALEGVAAMIREGTEHIAIAHANLRWEYAEKART